MENRLNYLIAGLFVLLVFLTIIFVTLILPASTFQPAVTKEAVVYTPQQLRGRDIYRREGCFYCHTQFVRYQDWDAGEQVKAGDYVYEAPHVLGTERTGPDLSNIGGKYADAWHYMHHVNPRRVKPGSIMPSFAYLSHEDMTDLVAYLQTLGAKRKLPSWIEPPQEYRDKFHHVSSKVNVNASASANSGRGIYMQNCAQCHGITGKGNGPVSQTMPKKPANLTRPFYKAYSDAMYYWRIAESVPGSRMPKWNRALSDEDLLYLVAFVKTLPVSDAKTGGDVETRSMAQLDRPEPESANYNEIDALTGHSGSPYHYGGGRGH